MGFKEGNADELRLWIRQFLNNHVLQSFLRTYSGGYRPQGFAFSCPFGRGVEHALCLGGEAGGGWRVLPWGAAVAGGAKGMLACLDEDEVVGVGYTDTGSE